MPWYFDIIAFGALGIIGIDQVRRGNNAVGAVALGGSAYYGWQSMKIVAARRQVEQDKVDYERAEADIARENRKTQGKKAADSVRISRTSK